MTPEITIRPAESVDAEDLTRIISQLPYLSINQQNPEPRRLALIRRQLKRAMQDPQSHIFVAHQPDRGVVGFVSLHIEPYLIVGGNSGFVSELFIDETCRGQGVGQRLLAAAQDKARELDCVRVMLINAKKRESYRRGFYAKNGWTEWSEVAVFYHKLGAD
jgi:GNAT superfamily N-acetyltransferase